MSILVNKNTRVIFQGITGKLGQYYSLQMIEYGTQVVAGVTPGKKGQVVNGVPVYNTIKEAKEKHGAECAMVFVPAPFTRDAFMECIDAEMDLVLCLTEGVPVQDMMLTRARLKSSRTKLLGPNSPGIVTPGEFISGLMPKEAFVPGNIGIVSRSGTLTYQTAEIMNRAGFGESTCLGIGGDPIGGMGFIDVLPLFEKDPQTKAVVIIGEIGGQGEETAAAFIKNHMTKPVVAFVAGRSAPEGKTMGHAGAIISAGKGTYQSKARAFEEAGVPVAKIITDIPKLMKERMRS
jgi:succinyl-CoA synthetase alpha subunit